MPTPTATYVTGHLAADSCHAIWLTPRPLKSKLTVTASLRCATEINLITFWIVVSFPHISRHQFAGADNKGTDRRGAHGQRRRRPGSRHVSVVLQLRLSPNHSSIELAGGGGVPLD